MNRAREHSLSPESSIPLITRVFLTFLLFCSLAFPAVVHAEINCNNGEVAGVKAQIQTLEQSACVAQCNQNACGEFLGSKDFSCVRHCENQHTTPFQILKSCGGGVLSNLSGMITFPWDVFYQTVETSREMAERQKDPDAVRQLAFEAGFLTKISDKDIKDYTPDEKKKADTQLADIEIGDLLRKRENVRSVAARDSKYEKFLRDHHVPLPNLDSKTAPIENVVTAVEAGLRAKGIRWQCLNDAGRAAMFCDELTTLATATMGLKSLAKLGELKAATLAEDLGSTSSSGNKIAIAVEKPALPSESVLKANPPTGPPSAESVLGRPLDPEVKQAIHEAHEVGKGQIGRDGTDAKIGNFTDSQIREKAQLLKRVGVDRPERRQLFKKGVVGYNPDLVEPGTVVAVSRSDGGLSNAKVIRRTKDTIDVQFTDTDGVVKLKSGVPISSTSERLASASGHLKVDDTVFLEVKGGGLAQGKLVKLDGSDALVEFQSKNAQGAIETFRSKVAASDLRTVGSSVDVRKVTGDFNPGKITRSADASGKVQVEVNDPRGTFSRAIDPAELRPRQAPNSTGPAPAGAPPSPAQVARPAPVVAQPAPLVTQPRSSVPAVALRPAKNAEVFYHPQGQRYGLKTFCPNAPCGPSQIASQLYGRGGHDILRKIEGINKSWSPLIADPGVAQRFDEFSKFVKEHNLQSDDPWVARGKFAESLGTKKVYRALALSPEEYEQVKLHGIKPPAVAVANKTAQPGPINVVDQIQRRLTFGRSPDYVQSVTSHPDVAASVAKSVGKGKPIYIFELDIPKIDLLYVDQEGKIIGQHAPTNWGRDMKTQNLEIVGTDGKVTKHDLNDEVESMVLFNIPPEEISGVRIQDPSTAPTFRYAPKVAPPSSGLVN